MGKKKPPGRHHNTRKIMFMLNNILAVLFIFMLAIFEEVEGCRPEPFYSLVIVDKNVKRTDFVNNVVQNFPDGSIFDTPILFQGTVSSASMDNEIYMKLDENRKMAEIVLVFVNTGTILDGEPEFSKKKKTFVVVFGSSVPETWKNVATDDNHLFLVTRDSNSSMISESLIKQLECDSTYYSDIDMYSKKKGQTCMPCSNLCGANPEQGSMTCSQYCPCCRPEPFHSLVIIDKNVERTDFVNNVVQNFPDGSIVGRPISFGGTVSSASMDNEIYMKLDENRKMAEIVLVFVNTGTILDGEPEFSRKKKTLVVVFGSSVPETWKNVATDDNHFFLVARDSNSSMISERLIKQLQCDSKYYCDIDKYSRKKGQTCMPCSNVCGANPEQVSKSCSHYCPYLSLKSKKIELEASSDSPGKYTNIIRGAVIMGLPPTVVVFVSVVYYTMKKKLVTGNTSEGSTMSNVNVTDSHQNTETTQEDAQSQTSQRLQGDSQTTTYTDGCIVIQM